MPRGSLALQHQNRSYTAPCDALTDSSKIRVCCHNQNTQLETLTPTGHPRPSTCLQTHFESCFRRTPEEHSSFCHVWVEIPTLFDLRQSWNRKIEDFPIPLRKHGPRTEHSAPKRNQERSLPSWSHAQKSVSGLQRKIVPRCVSTRAVEVERGPNTTPTKHVASLAGSPGPARF